MKAIGTHADKLLEITTDTPTLQPHDLLVEVKGISVNPVDTKMRERTKDDADTKIFGYDAAGIVHQVGDAVTDYKVGDAVFYAGDLTRNGTNAQFHAVDARIVGKKPRNLNFAEAAGLPLTSITAWELLFDSLNLKEGDGAGESILIIGGAGGVGSILIQLAKKLTKLNVIATASRPETIDWVKKMGADQVVNHRNNLAEEVAKLGIQPRYIAALTATEQHFDAMIELIQPRGHIAIIDDPDTLDIKAGKLKALSFSWEFMFTRSMFQTKDITAQQTLLNRVSEMLEDGTLQSTVTQNLGKLTPQTLDQAHQHQLTATAIGKTVLEGIG